MKQQISQKDLTQSVAADNKLSDSSHIQHNSKSLRGITKIVIFFTLGVVVASIIWFMFSRSADSPSGSRQIDIIKAAQENQEEKFAEEWVEYKNTDAQLKFKYPETWLHTLGDPYIEGGELGEVSGQIKSPEGNVLDWKYTVLGGKGGDCEPNYHDVAFASGNKCSSKYIYSAEILPITTASPENKLLKNSSKNLVLSKTKYKSSNTDSPTTYQICLDDQFLVDARVAVGTRMGLLFPCEYWTTGFNATFTLQNEAAFESEEAKTAETIMRTFDAL